MKVKGIKLISFMLILGAVIAGCSYYKYSNEGTKPNTDTESSTETSASSADLAFAVFGDVHDNIGNFQDAIDDMYKINPNMDALVLNGDTVDQGKNEQYDEVQKAIDKNKKKLPENIIKNLGNHEFYNYDEDTNSEEAIKDFTDKYLDFAGTDKVYHDTWIKGYHFISLGSDDLTSEDLSSTQASLSEEQISWFKEKLNEDYEQGKPIFVFIHQPISVNFFGRAWYGVKQGDELQRILDGYPEAVVFSSHTHKEFYDDYIKEDQPYTFAHTGAIGYTFVNDESSDSGRKRDSSANNALYIEVNGDKVTLNGRDIKNHKWVYSKEITKEDK
ncbi:MAG: metallophosphoesterase [Clostridium sp.]|nr:metallophosphoesterase [Clostridium sp.]